VSEPQCCCGCKDWTRDDQGAVNVVCPECAFAFDEIHADLDDTYSCPNCGHGEDDTEADAMTRADLRAQINETRGDLLDRPHAPLSPEQARGVNAMALQLAFDVGIDLDAKP